MAQLYSFAVLLGGLALLTILVVRGRSIFVVAPLCALATVALSGGNALEALNQSYMAGFADYVKKFYLIFALGAAFGKLMETSGAAVAIAHGIGRLLGPRRACLAVVLACAVLTYGGVSLFVVGFSVYPLAVQLFRAADLPRRFIPAAIAFGSVTFTMTTAGSPEIQNLIPIQYLVDAVTQAPLTDARAGWPASLIVAVTMFALGQWYLEWAIRRDVARGEHWQERAGDLPAAAAADRPHPSLWLALSPLLVTLAMLNVVPAACHGLAGPAATLGLTGTAEHLLRSFPEDPTLSIFVGVLTALVVLHITSSGVGADTSPTGAGSHSSVTGVGSYKHGWEYVGEGFLNGLAAIGSTASVVGFGSAVQKLPAFLAIVDWVTHLPGDPLIGAALAVAVIAAIAGSASGGQGLALPIIKPIYIDMLGVAPRALHRVVSIASGSLDSLPHNGYLVMLIRNICGDTHARAYGPIFVTTVLIPALGTAVAIALFKLVPAWANM